MSTAIQIPLTDRERSERHDQFLREMEPFTRELTRIHNYAPHPGFRILDNGEFELLPLAKIYQDQIDRLMKMRDDYINSNYPEYLKSNE